MVTFRGFLLKNSTSIPVSYIWESPPGDLPLPSCEVVSSCPDFAHLYILRETPGGLPYITDGDARRNFQKQPPRATTKSYHNGCSSSQFYSLKDTSEIFIHRNNTGILKIIAKGQQVLQ